MDRVTHVRRSFPPQTLPMVAPPKQDTPGHQEADNDVSPPLVPPPPSCNPQSVSPLAALGVVVTLAEALVDCLLSGEYRFVSNFFRRYSCRTRVGLVARFGFLAHMCF